MPYKHNESCRHKFTKATYKVLNWPEYNKSLCRRGDITIWFTEEAIIEWRPAKTGGSVALTHPAMESVML